MNRLLRMAALLVFSGALVLLLLSLPDSQAAGVNQYQMFVFEEDKEYEVGDGATLEINIFDRDKYTDIDEFNISINLNYYRKTGRYLEVDEISDRITTGIYEIAFTIQEGDVNYGMVEVDITANIIAEGDSKTYKVHETVWLHMVEDDDEYERTGFYIEVEVDNEHPRPGETVTFSVSFINNTLPFDPDPENDTIDIRFGFSPFLFENETRGNLTVLTRQSVGNYTYTVTVPENETRGGLYWLGVNGYLQYLGGTFGFARADLAFYDCWLHTIEFTIDSFTGELYVTDLSGEPVVNAEVSVRYLYETDVEPRGVYRVSDWVNDTTDEAGVMELDFQFENLDTHQDVELTIFVNSTYQEAWEVDLEPPPVYPVWGPHEEGLDVLPLQARMVPRDSRARMDYETYYEGEAIKNGEFYVYIFDPTYDVANPAGRQPVLEVYKVTSNEEGELTLNLETPTDCEGLGLDFKSEVAEGEWAEEGEGVVCYLQGDPSIGVELTSFEVGGWANVTVSTSGLTESAGALLFVTPVGSRTTVDLPPYEDDLFLTANYDWVRVERMPEVEEGTLRKLENGSANLSMRLPGIFPDADNYLVLVAVFEEGEVTFNYFVVDAEGQVVTAEGGGADDDGGFLPGPCFIMAVLVAIFVALLRRRG